MRTSFKETEIHNTLIETVIFGDKRISWIYLDLCCQPSEVTFSDRWLCIQIEHYSKRE